MAQELLSEADIETHIVLVTDGGYKVANNYNISSMEELIAKLFLEDVSVSVMSVTERMNCYKQLYESTGGMFIDFSNSMEEGLDELLKVVTEEVENGYWITLAGQMPEHIKLLEKPSADSMADTDGDMLTDWEELSGMAEKNVFNPNMFLLALNEEYYSFLPEFPVYSYKSNPAKIDTDNDEIDDYEEILIGTYPKKEDTDGDGLNDGEECLLWFDPLNANLDGDSYSDLEENELGQNPYSYDLSPSEYRLEFLKGYFGGDFIREPSGPALFGQILSGFTPVIGDVGDVRDVFANIGYGEWGMALLCAVGVITNAGNATKTSEKLADVIKRFGTDNTDELMALFVDIANKYPQLICKLLPASLADDLIKSVKETGTYSRHFYDEINKIIVTFGKKIPSGLEFYGDVEVITYTGVKPWELGWTLRGQLLDLLLGNNVGRYFPTYDIYEKGVATSIKSIDIGCPTYKTSKGFLRQLEKYAKALEKGTNRITINGESEEVTKKVLQLVFPDISLSNKQSEALKQFIDTWKNKFDIKITIVP